MKISLFNLQLKWAHVALVTVPSQCGAYLLELVQKRALVFTPASPLHPLLNHLVQDSCHSIRTHPFQQVQPVAADIERGLRLQHTEKSTKQMPNNGAWEEGKMIPT